MLFQMRVMCVVVLAVFAAASASAVSSGWTLMPEWAPPIDGFWPGAADLDGDGDIDLLVYDGHTCSGLRNDGGCLVGPWSSNPAWCDGLPGSGACTYPRLDLADLDEDGDDDALVGCYYGWVLFYENTGTSSEPAWTRNDDYFYANWYSSHFRAPAATDLDGDGDLDIVSGLSGVASHLIVYWNDGTPEDPAWVEDRDFFSSITPVGTSVEPNFADIDQDGDLDLVAFPIDFDNAPPNVYENIGSAVSPVWLENPGLLSGVDPVHSYWGAVLRDLDCDGRPDLLMFVIDEGAYDVQCYRNDGPITPVEPMSWGVIKAMYR